MFNTNRPEQQILDPDIGSGGLGTGVAGERMDAASRRCCLLGEAEVLRNGWRLAAGADHWHGPQNVTGCFR